MEYKISERPYPQIGYNMDYIRAANAFNNPWAGLGALLGAVLTKNYVDRGERKLMDSMKDSIPTSDTAQTEAQITQKMLENRPSQEETGKQALFDAYEKANNNSIQPNYEIGLEKLKNQSTDPIEIAALQSVINKAQPQEAEIGKVTPNEINGFNKYFQENMPHMDAQGNISNMDAAANLQAQRAQVAPQGIPKFSADEWEAKMWQEGKKQGRPDYQIQAVIDRMKPQALQAEKRYKEAQENYLTNAFQAEMPLDNGYGGNAVNRLGILAELEGLGTESARRKAAVLGAGSLTQRDIININNAKEARQNKNNLEMYKIQNGGKGAGRTGGNSSLKVPNKIAEIDAAKQRLIEGGMTAEQANAWAQEQYMNVGKTAGQTKAQKSIDEFADKLDAPLTALINAVNSYDVGASGDALTEIQGLIDENPKMWEQLPAEIKREIYQQMYNANGVRQAIIGDYDGSRKYFGALTPEAVESHGWNISPEKLYELAKNYKK